MKTRVIGVVTTLAAITVVLAGIVFTIAAIQDYQANRGESFIERAASIVGIGTLKQPEQDAQVKIETTNDDDVAEPDSKSSDSPEIFRFFGRTEDNEEWLDDLFDREWLDREESFRFEDRIERMPDLPRFERFEELPFDSFEFERPRRTDWLGDLVERGVMTQDELNQLKSWIDNLPDSFDGVMPRFLDERNFEFESDDGHFRFRGRWRMDEPDNDSSEEHEDEDRFELGADKGISF